ncbi:MAG: ABC transporter permease, partial [Candidatus Dormiibacterota bacterium]
VVRLLQLIPVLIIASIGIWALIYLLPGDPALTMLGQNATPAQVTAVRRELGLNEPLPVQYLTWVGRIFEGNFGTSYQTGLPVTALIGPRALASLQLGFLAFLFSVVVGVPLGVFAAARPQSWIGTIIGAYNSLTLALPSYFLGILLILVFGVWLKILPTASAYVPIWVDPGAAITASILPVINLGTYVSGIIARFVRSAMVDVLRADYVRTARAKGVRELLVVWKHALRNAMLPTITILGLQFGAFIGGAVVTEGVFNYPGMGSLILNAVLQRDYPTVQATILLIVLAFTVVNLAVDVLYALLNPRVHYA